jgi:type II restriction enzyme
MISSIRSERAPSLLLLQYSSLWRIQNLVFVPRYFLTESVIEKRRPLAITARRAGWVGCNILLSRIAEEGKIRIVIEGTERKKECVREQYRRIEGIKKIPILARGWSLDVLNAMRQLKKSTFSLEEAYLFEEQLRSMHPRNNNIRAKIRQQLQLLRDLGLLRFLGNGEYEFLTIQ